MKEIPSLLGWFEPLFRQRPDPGASPGTINVDPEAPRPVIRMICYGPDRIDERTVEDPSELGTCLDSWPVTWINVDGLGDADVIRGIWDAFGLHPLTLEDVIHVDQRPKVEDFGDHLFLITRSIAPGREAESEQVSMFLGKGFVLTFQERPGDCFEPVRERIRKSIGRIRKRGPDYLVYALVDSVVDHYFPVLESFVERAEALEDEVLDSPEHQHVVRIQELKREIMGLRRNVWPMREVIHVLLKEEVEHFTDETRIFLRDGYDNALQLIDILDSYRELGSGLMDAYLSSMTNRTNDVMKLLTVIATIFIPLTFIAGIYGMNFDRDASPWNLPELGWYWGYPMCLGLMLAVAAMLLVYFRRKGWLGSGSR
jgi:magnesium transporter